MRPQSRPMRARGLKRHQHHQSPLPQHVAPHAGAWIETRPGRSGYGSERVAPHAGAWIETPVSPAGGKVVLMVAPHAGAWIET